MAHSSHVNIEANFSEKTLVIEFPYRQEQTLYRRVQLAAAVFVVKTTHKLKNSIAHALDLQQNLKIRWLYSTLSHDSSSVRLYYDQHILAQQQNDLSSKLTSVLYQYPQDILKDDYFNPPESYDCGLDQQPKLNEACASFYNNLIASRDRTQDNANFIQAVMLLKSLAESQSIVPEQQYIHCISKFNNSKEHVSPSPHFNDFRGQGTLSVSGYSSNLLLYIINSCSAVQLVDKSVFAILMEINEIACRNESKETTFIFNEAINEWVGSIYQQAVGALWPIIGGHSAHLGAISSGFALCFSLAQAIILQLIDDSITNKMSHHTKESQVVLLLQLSEGTSMWFHTVEFILSQFAKCAQFIKRSLTWTNSHLGNRQYSLLQRHRDFQLVNRSFFLLRLVKVYFSRAAWHLQLLQNAALRDAIAPEVQPKVNSVGKLWRKCFSVQNRTYERTESRSRLLSAQGDVQRWKHILEISLGHALFLNPTMALIIFDCVQLLPALHDQWN